jgi:hypothetical protein
MENRNTLLLDFQVEPADGTAERRAAIAMADERLAGQRRITMGGDKVTIPATSSRRAVRSGSLRTSRRIMRAPVVRHSTHALYAILATRSVN